MPPRVLIIMPDQSRRALLRASLREVGYDAIGAAGTADARRYRAIEPGRGVVGLLVVDHNAIVSDRADLDNVVAAHRAPLVLLIAHGTHAVPPGPWSRIVRRPLAVADIVAAVEELVPLPEAARHPLDAGGGSAAL